jgi:hypothetical protein
MSEKDSKFVKYPSVDAIYQHYKGGRYKVIGIGKHSETNELLVICKSIEFGSIHARPLDTFFEKVTNSTGNSVSRFY